MLASLGWAGFAAVLLVVAVGLKARDLQQRQLQRDIDAHRPVPGERTSS